MAVTSHSVTGFSDILGQGAALALLSRLLDAGSVPPALILTGTPGCGRRTVARALAAALTCERAADSRPSGQAGGCGQCQSCQLVSADSHPDVVVLPGDEQRSDIPVAMIRDEVVAAASQSPLVADKRVFIIPAAERLRGEAANALLKVLEEPPADTHLILSAAHASTLLKTIQTRAQVVRLAPLSKSDVARILEGGGIDQGQAQQRAAQSNGSHRGLWGEHLEEPPLAAMQKLLAHGVDQRLVAEIMDALPRSEREIPSGSTLAAEQRRVLSFWLAVLIDKLRIQLRGDQPDRAVAHIEAVVRLRADLRVYLQPRLIIEGLGLAGQAG